MIKASSLGSRTEFGKTVTVVEAQGRAAHQAREFQASPGPLTNLPVGRYSRKYQAGIWRGGHNQDIR